MRIAAGVLRVLSHLSLNKFMKRLLTLLFCLVLTSGFGQIAFTVTWTTNRPTAILTVDLDSTLLVNGVPIGTGTGTSGSTNNFIPSTNGVGIGTIIIGPVLQTIITNYTLSPYSTVTITNSTNPLVTGSYVADTNMTDVLYTLWTPQLWGGWSGYNINWKTNLYLIFTNTVCTNGLTNGFQICMVSGRSPSGWGKDWNGWNPIYFLGSLTNAPHQSPYGTPNPASGNWGFGYTVDNPTSTATFFSTSPAGSTFFDGTQFVPFTHDWSLNDQTVLVFEVKHNFGHYAHMVAWSFICIHPDANMGSVPDDKMGVENSQVGYYGSFHSTANSESFSPAGPLSDIGNLGWSFWRKDGGGARNLSSFTNYVLHVEFYP
jgi:hypothetical protein